MNNLLEETPQSITTKIFKSGLSMAKKSMEQILQCDISIREVDFGDSIVDKVWVDDEYLLIKTDIKGQVLGTNLLVFKDEEVNKIFEACLPASIVNEDTEATHQMKMGFLSEVDNMVAAAVITELANFLGLDIYGDVPILQKMNTEALTEYVKSELVAFDSIVRFKAIFHSSTLNISPDFVWIFQDEIMDKIKSSI